MRYKDFSYSKINAEPFVDSEGLKFLANRMPGKDYIFLSYYGADKEENPHLKRTAGWKFHISVDDVDTTNIERAWNVLADYVIENRLTTMKVLKAGKLASEVSQQRGKQITLHAYHDPDKEWARILTDITRLLTENGIKPSYRPPSDRPLSGSNYLSYRNDAVDARGNKVSSDKSSYNPKGLADPFEAIVVNVPGQPEIPIWMDEETVGAAAGFGASS